MPTGYRGARCSFFQQMSVRGNAIADPPIPAHRLRQHCVIWCTIVMMRLFARTRSFSLVDGVARSHRHPIETARLRGIGGGSSARLSAGCRGVTGPHPVALAFASDWLLQATIIHHLNTYTSITATKAAPFSNGTQADILLSGITTIDNPAARNLVPRRHVHQPHGGLQPGVHQPCCPQPPAGPGRTRSSQ